MPKSSSRTAARPTPYAELNDVLAELVTRLQDTLGDNLVGAYLQGSFALGDFDEHSDVDLTFVTQRDLTRDEIPALDAAHQRVYDLPSVWAQHLEGSYMPAPILRSWSTAPRDPPDDPRFDSWSDPQGWQRAQRVYPFLYLNNGARALVRSEHDNSRVVRWLLRERGLALTGPPARTLVDPVRPDDLRAEVREVMASVAGQLAADPSPMRARWYQGFMAVFVARVLQTLVTGQIHSKLAAVAFAEQALEPRWARLVKRGWECRLDAPRGRDAPAAYAADLADPADVADTLALLQASSSLEAGLTQARDTEDRAQAIIARTLALKRQGQGYAATRPSLTSGRPPPHGGWSPTPIRPNGRGKRG